MNQEQNNINQSNAQQPNNLFQSQNTNNPNLNNKTHKNKLGLIIGIIIAVIVVVISIVFGIKLFNNPTSTTNTENNSSKPTNTEVATITGKAKFIKSFEGYTNIKNCGRYYFTLENDQNIIVIDANGKIVASGVASYTEPYCYDDGTIIINNDAKQGTDPNKNYSVWRNCKEIYSFEYPINYNYHYYESDILYYEPVDGPIKAHNLKTKKELWTADTKGSGISPVVLENVVILKCGEKNAILNKETGKMITNINDNNDIYASYSDYYIKTCRKEGAPVWLDYLEVYDYNSNLISTLDIDDDDKC